MKDDKHAIRSRRFAGAAAVALLFGVLASCGTDDSRSNGSADVGAEAGTPEGYPRTVEHAMGEAELADRPERIVALDMSFVDATLALGRPLAGYTLYQDPDGPLPAYFGEDADELASDAVYLGDLLEPNLEAIAALQPDVILTAKVRHESIYAELSGIAPTIMSESAGTGWKDNLRLAGEALGEEERADEVLADLEDRAATVGAAINAAHDDPTISVVRFAAADKFRLYQRGSFSGVVLDDAGLARPENQQATTADQFITEVSMENLTEADAGADVMFFTIPGNEDSADETANDGRATLDSSSLWQSLPTVSSGDAHEASDEVWMSAVGLYGAHGILDDLAETFDVDPAR